MLEPDLDERKFPKAAAVLDQSELELVFLGAEAKHPASRLKPRKRVLVVIKSCLVVCLEWFILSPLRVTSLRSKGNAEIVNQSETVRKC